MGRAGVLWLPWIAAALALALVLAWLTTSTRTPEPPRAKLDVLSALAAGGNEGFLRADAPREFRFPDDHRAHDGFKTEWWYFTGNVQTPEGRRFGYQLTFFRSALAAQSAPRESSFAASHAWMAHFALSDVGGGKFHAFERFARESGGLAGASGEPLRVWLRDWRCEFGADGAPARLVAAQEGLAIDLALESSKPPVLHGERGLSRKNAGAGNASFYYSLTRLATTGTIHAGGASFDVRGNSWMDREWMTSELALDQVGWDWFALQLDDGTELMWYRLRRADGSSDPFDAGSFVAADGTRTALGAGEVVITESDGWTSPKSKARYPSRWHLACVKLGLELDVTPALADQELDLSFRYWEGAADVRGTRDGRAVKGRGYVELVGYDGRRPESKGGAAR